MSDNQLMVLSTLEDKKDSHIPIDKFNSMVYNTVNNTIKDLKW